MLMTTHPRALWHGTDRARCAAGRCGRRNCQVAAATFWPWVSGPKQIEEAQAAQHAAAHDESGHVRVVAGPGTGKSATIEERVCWLRVQGVDPEDIAAVSFTRAAARSGGAYRPRARQARLRGQEDRGQHLALARVACAEGRSRPDRLRASKFVAPGDVRAGYLHSAPKCGDGGQVPKILRSLLALIAVFAALPSAAEAAKSTTYYATSTDPFQAAMVTVRGERVISAAWMVQPFSYDPIGIAAGSSTVPGVPAYGTFSKVKISRRGIFNLLLQPSNGGQTTGGCLSGKLQRGKLRLASNASGSSQPRSFCGPPGDKSCSESEGCEPPPALGVSKRPPVRGPQTFTGASTSAQDEDPEDCPSNTAPGCQPTGPAGTLTLTLDGQGNISGTGSFAPVDPGTGLPTGGPQVNVTYASAPLLNARAGIFQLNASVTGYDVCGAIAGNGTVSGLVSCQQGTYFPSTFALGSS
jgi:UvrD/REP helicase N-terminal domain